MPFLRVMILSCSYWPAEFFLSLSLPILVSTSSRAVFRAVMIASDMFVGRTRVRRAVQESATETLVSFHKIRRSDVSILACKHCVGYELRKVITTRRLGGLGEVFLRDTLGTPSGHHAVDVRGLSHSNLILTAVDMYAEEI